MVKFIKEIITFKRREVEKRKKVLSFPQLYKMAKITPSHSLFSQALLSGQGIIAEIKRASPSRGIFRSEIRIEELGKIYQENGASALSFVTEERYFLGNIEDFQKIRKVVDLPILRKDFIIDEYQIVESKLWGADALLLIADLLSPQKLRDFLQMIKDIEIEALVEIHSEKELMQALKAGAEIIGINNRNLNTFQVDLTISKKLLPLIPDNKIKVVESGIHTRKDLLSYQKYKVNGFLIGEALMKSCNPGKKLQFFCSWLKENDQN